MTDRIQNLVDAGRLSREPTADDEVAGLWTNAVQAFHDAQVDSISANGRLLRAYDARTWSTAGRPAHRRPTCTVRWTSFSGYFAAARTNCRPAAHR
jgi:hypothetical protein